MISDKWMSAIEAALPDSDLSRIEVVSEGLHHEAVIIEGAWVARLPKSDSAREGLESQAAKTSLIARVSPVPVPDISLHPPGFALHRLIPGEPLLQLDLARANEPERRQAASDLRGFLMALQQISQSDLQASGARLPSDPPSLGPVEELRESALAELAPRLTRPQRRWLDMVFEPALDGEIAPPAAWGVVHGDLSPQHLLWDPARCCLNGIIDHSSLGFGDPAVDLAQLIHQYGLDCLPGLAEGMEDLLPRAVWRASITEVVWALDGVRTGDPYWTLAHLGLAAPGMVASP